MRIFFKETFSGLNLNFNAALLDQLKARAKSLIDKEGSKAELQKATGELLRHCKPSNWNVHIDGNATVQNELDYGLMILSMEQHTSKDIRKLSIMEFYQLKAWIELKNKPNGRG